MFTGHRGGALFVGVLAVLTGGVAAMPVAAAGYGLFLGMRGAIPLADALPATALASILLLAAVLLALGAWRLLAGSTEITIARDEMVVESGVAWLRWNKRAPLAAVRGIQVVQRGRWHGIDIQVGPDQHIRAGTGTRDRAAWLSAHLRSAVQEDRQ